jgi:hypothetical protein
MIALEQIGNPAGYVDVDLESGTLTEVAHGLGRKPSFVQYIIIQATGESAVSIFWDKDSSDDSQATVIATDTCSARLVFYLSRRHET